MQELDKFYIVELKCFSKLQILFKGGTYRRISINNRAYYLKYLCQLNVLEARVTERYKKRDLCLMKNFFESQIFQAS
jgi:hypothetical protein